MLRKAKIAYDKLKKNRYTKILRGDYQLVKNASEESTDTNEIRVARQTNTTEAETVGSLRQRRRRDAMSHIDLKKDIQVLEYLLLGEILDNYNLI